jgi:hypothetical protein
VNTPFAEYDRLEPGESSSEAEHRSSIPAWFRT